MAGHIIAGGNSLENKKMNVTSVKTLEMSRGDPEDLYWRQSRHILKDQYL